mgnify:CR=1 FL=1
MGGGGVSIGIVVLIVLFAFDILLPVVACDATSIMSIGVGRFTVFGVSSCDSFSGTGRMFCGDGSVDVFCVWVSSTCCLSG